MKSIDQWVFHTPNDSGTQPVTGNRPWVLRGRFVGRTAVSWGAAGGVQASAVGRGCAWMVVGESQLDDSITPGEERGKYTGDIHNNVRHGVGTYE